MTEWQHNLTCSIILDNLTRRFFALIVIQMTFKITVHTWPREIRPCVINFLDILNKTTRYGKHSRLKSFLIGNFGFLYWKIKSYFHLMRTLKHNILSICLINMAKFIIFVLIFGDFVWIAAFLRFLQSCNFWAHELQHFTISEACS